MVLAEKLPLLLVIASCVWADSVISATLVVYPAEEVLSPALFFFLSPGLKGVVIALRSFCKSTE